MTDWFGLGGILGMSAVHMFAYGTMTVLAIKAVLHWGAILRLRLHFRLAEGPHYMRRGNPEEATGQQVAIGSSLEVMDAELTKAARSAQSSGTLLPLESALLRIFDPVIDGCERGLFYCPSFGLFFTVIGGLLAILSSVGSGHFDRNAMIEGIGIAMATTAAGFMIAMIEYWSLQTAERLRGRLFAELAEAVTLSTNAGEGAVS